jgi:AhpD family alkylhydroperoxidase
MSMATLAPRGYQAVLDLNSYVVASVDAQILALIKIRASILNGCAYCADMHGSDAIGRGESIRRLLAIATWRDAPFFSPQERAALALTDAVTRLGAEGVSDEVWTQARAQWSEPEVANLILAIAIINVWNRIAVSTQMQPPVG